jgi:hypothetical protein
VFGFNQRVRVDDFFFENKKYTRIRQPPPGKKGDHFHVIQTFVQTSGMTDERTYNPCVN